MASVKFQRESDEWHMFQDFWRICQDYWNPEKADEYWESVTDSVKKFYEKYKIPLSKQLGLALMTDLTTRSISATKSGSVGQ